MKGIMLIGILFGLVIIAIWLYNNDDYGKYGF